MRLRENEKKKVHKNLIVEEEEVKEVKKAEVVTPPTTGDFIKDFYLELPSIPEGEERGKNYCFLSYRLYTQRKECYGSPSRRITNKWMDFL